jgi:cyclic pyranopterin phosphate synthase
LDTLQKEKYKIITGFDKFNNVLEGIGLALNKGFYPVKINVVLLKEINSDEITDFINLTQHKNLIVRFIEFMPVSNSIDWNKYFIGGEEVLEKAKELGEVESKNIFKEFGPAKYYKIKGYKGDFGLITAISNSFCSQCNRLRLTSTGELILCLHNNISFNLRFLLKNTSENEIKQIIKYAVLHKPKAHNLKLPDFSKDYIIKNSVSMCYIGG